MSRKGTEKAFCDRMLVLYFKLQGGLETQLGQEIRRMLETQQKASTVGLHWLAIERKNGQI
jgi:hypothetical protein